MKGNLYLMNVYLAQLIEAAGLPKQTSFDCIINVYIGYSNVSFLCPVQKERNVSLC